MAECDGGKSTSGIRDTNSLELLGQEAGDSGGMGGLAADLRYMRKGDGLRGRGGSPGAVVETGVSG